jgi:S13-like protein
LFEDRRLQNQGRRPRLSRRRNPRGGVAIAAVSTRSLERRVIALSQANHVRSARAKLKQDLRAGKVRLEQILATPADYLASAELFDLLVAVPKIGPVKASRLLTVARISPSKTVGDLSERQRAHLIEQLGRS